MNIKVAAFTVSEKSINILQDHKIKKPHAALFTIHALRINEALQHGQNTKKIIKKEINKNRSINTVLGNFWKGGAGSSKPTP